MLKIDDFKRHLIDSGKYKLFCITIQLADVPFWNIVKSSVLWKVKEQVGIQAEDIQDERMNKLRSSYMVNFTDEEWRICKNIYSSRCHQFKRIKSRISKLLDSGPCFFLTFTLNDDHVNDSLNLLERRIKELFRSSGIDQYIAHQDFGIDDRYTHRLHYHAICRAESLSQIKSWKYGFYCYKPITNKNDSRLACYLNKLSCHYVKSSNYNRKVIYSRKK